MPLAGIYVIRCLANQKVYVGSSINIENRWHRHKWLLRTGKHFNSHLQRAWDKYGEDNFTFEVIDLMLPVGNAIQRAEVDWIKKLKAGNKKYGFNKRLEVRGVLIHSSIQGSNHSKSKLTESDVLNILEKAKSGRTAVSIAKDYSVTDGAIRNILSGIIWKHFPREIFSPKQNQYKLKEKDVLEIKHLLKEGESCTSLSKKFNVSITTVMHVAKGHTWSHVGDSITPYKKASNNKLTEEKVVQIRILLKENVLSHQKIADMFGTSRSNVGRIGQGICWAGVGEVPIDRQKIKHYALTSEEVEEIQSIPKTESARNVAKRYGVGRSIIDNIRNGTHPLCL